VRFDAARARAAQYSRSWLRAWIDAGNVTLTVARRRDAPRPRRQHVARGGRARHAAPAAGDRARDRRRDDALLVVDKPAGLVVHPGAGNRSGTLQNALLHHAPELAAAARGIVHRLDKDTSGLLVVAKTLPAHTNLVRQLAAYRAARVPALAAGDLRQGGTLSSIGRHPTRRTTTAVVATGKPARTHYAIVERFGVAAPACRLDTGCTLIAFTCRRHPLVGDPAYGRKGPVPLAGRRCMRRVSRCSSSTGRAPGGARRCPPTSRTSGPLSARPK
jgi:23S rRNA pseudouridine1911/1915/1917 synthase